MKKDGQYRYTLQFGSQNDAEYKAGELLERLGNKKSAVIVAALNEYMLSHPELQNPYCKIEIKVNSNLNQDRVEQIVRSIVEEKLSMLQLSGTATPKVENISNALEQDVVTMLDNLDLFG